MEANDTAGQNAELIYLKKYYSLLEIKDYILMNELRTKCKLKPLSILYFYGKASDCPECQKTGTVLTYLRQQYPELRIYAFDSNLELSALDTLKTTFKVSNNALPALIIGDEQYIGFKTIEEIKDLLPELKEIDKAREIEAASSSANTKIESVSAPGARAETASSTQR